MPLSTKQIENAKPKEKDYKLSDGEGMFLLVKKNGSKYWRLKYRFLGKEKTFSLGVYPLVKLSTARSEKSKAKLLLNQGIDPSAKKKADKTQVRLNTENNFKAIALEWFDIHQKNKVERHKSRVKSRMERDLFPTLGYLPINQITAPVLLEALRAIEKRGAVESAHRTKQIAGQIFRYAIATGRAERDPTPDLKGALQPPIKKHHAALTEPRDVGHLMVAIDNFNGTIVVKTALHLSALFFCRPGEIRHLKWSDINYEENRIELIASKTKQQLIIPLCTQAIALIENLKAYNGSSPYLLPSARGGSRCLSENGVRVALRSMGYDNDTMTPHGFRAMARTLLDEILEYRIEWIEQQLAHTVKDPNGRAYNRTKHLKQRTEMMQAWADYLDKLRDKALAKNVVTGNFNRA
ncbi:MAG: putative integrase prophage protein [Osedax symbiont Rs2]|nr:MAG: putative integrase prophage protein [Osedax symbiont Rs2]NRA14962.1 integrase arm-type DNA-binding domain-containing protein [Oceanospirillaceae bacterium]